MKVESPAGEAAFGVLEVGLEGGGDELIERGVRLDQVAGRAVDDLILAGGQVAHVQVHVALAEDEVVFKEFVVAPAQVRLDEPLDGGVRPPATAEVSLA